MRAFAERCPGCRIGQQPAAQLPWFHLVTLLTKVDRDLERGWLCCKAVQEGWSRSALESNISNRLFDRQGQAVSNFEARMPADEAAIAKEALKDPFLFDFLGIGEEAQERDVERALSRYITPFLPVLGEAVTAKGVQLAAPTTRTLASWLGLSWARPPKPRRGKHKTIRFSSRTCSLCSWPGWRLSNALTIGRVADVPALLPDSRIGTVQPSVKCAFRRTLPRPANWSAGC